MHLLLLLSLFTYTISQETPDLFSLDGLRENQIISNGFSCTLQSNVDYTLHTKMRMQPGYDPAPIYDMMMQPGYDTMPIYDIILAPRQGIRPDVTGAQVLYTWVEGQYKETLNVVSFIAANSTHLSRSFDSIFYKDELSCQLDGNGQRQCVIIRGRPSNSQSGQDKWVYSVLGEKRGGYFIELGAADGLDLSNTLFFEKHLDWNGLLIEANPRYHETLSKYRKAKVSYDCVGGVAGKTVEFALSGLCSGVVTDNDQPSQCMEYDRAMILTTKTLASILDEAGAPSVIDYFSLDIEGLELEILSTFPFDRYIFLCLTVEHNAHAVGPKYRQELRDILERNGYVFIQASKEDNASDDYYVHNSVKEFAWPLGKIYPIDN